MRAWVRNALCALLFAGAVHAAGLLPLGGSQPGFAGSASIGTSATGNLTSTGGAPSAPTNLLLVNQGGAGNAANNSQGLAWTAATPGAASISYYRVYRNASKISTDGAVTGVTYTDSTATNSNVQTLDAVATPYFYQVSAVDTNGTEGPLTTDITLWGFQGTNGGSQWSAVDFSFGLTSQNWTDTTCSPVGGGVDWRGVFPAGGAGFQPYSNVPQVPQYDLELGGMTSGGSGFFQMDVKPQTSGNTVFFGLISRLPFGDVFNWKGPSDISVYGGLTANQWNTIRIPLTDLSIGNTTFTASIGSPYGTDTINGFSVPFATLTVTAVASGVGVDNGGFIISGTGVPANTYIYANSQNASIGTFKVGGPNITGSTVVASTTMVEQRTDMYKMAFGENGGQPGGAMCINNWKFTRQ
jgi:hypothetical protein